MKIPFTIVLLIISTILLPASALFSKSTTSNFTITGLNNPSKITLDSTGTKFIVWNPAAEIRIYDLNGTLICFNSFPKQIQRIVWNAGYFPMMLPYPGKQFSSINDTTCQIIKTWQLLKMIDTSKNDAICELDFRMKNDGPFATFSSRAAVNGVDLLSQSITNAYFPLDPSLPQPQTFVYSTDLKQIYLVFADPLTGNRNVQVYPTNSLTPKKAYEITFNTSLGALAASSDNKTIIATGTNISNDTLNVYRFDKEGNIKIKATRSRIDKTISIGEGNVVVLFKCQEGFVEVVRTGDGQSVQNITYSTSSYFYDADYKNKVLAVLDSLGRVITYSYEVDDDILPIPDPVDPGNSLPLWVIVAGAVAGVLILVVVLMCVFRKKLPQGVKKVFCGCCEGEKPEEKESLINDREEAQDKQSVRGEDQKSAKSEGKRNFLHLPDEPKQKPPVYVAPPPAANSRLREDPVEKPVPKVRPKKQQKEEKDFADERQDLLKGKKNDKEDQHEAEHLNKDFFVVKRKAGSQLEEND